MPLIDDLLDGLNPPQRTAVTAGDGPILVLAGPGSGKTRVLTRRIAYLLDVGQVDPYQMVAVTFTNKAAAEMRSRVQQMVGQRVPGLQVGTFHAICARILRAEADHLPYQANYVIYDTDDQIKLMGEVLRDLNIDPRKFTPGRVLAGISNAKNELILPGELPTDDYFSEIVARAYMQYQRRLVANNAMDFDDLLLQMVLALRDSANIREKYQRRFRYVLVDEFQDTNMAQYELVRLFGAPQDNIFAVGDEDQSIYAFRGANYRNVANFRQHYPQATTILLEQNYRSTQIVLDAAQAIIRPNRNRTHKQLFTDREGGARIVIREHYSEDYEAQFVTEQLVRHHRDGVPYEEMAVMYRTNSQSRALERACVEQNIPYTLVGGVGFYKRREVRDILAYLRIVNNPDDSVAFERVVNVPKRGIGDKTLRQFRAWAETEDIGYASALTRLVNGEASPLANAAAGRIADFARQVGRWRAILSNPEAGLLVLLDLIMADLGYNLYLREISDTPEEYQERSENVQELRGLLARADEEGLTLNDFLIDQSLMTDADTARTGDRVTLLTLHAAKGLEYSIVFITGVEQGLLPHQRSYDEADSYAREEAIAEERRLFYVGVTRAKERLYLTYAFRRATWGSNEPREKSDFLLDVPPELIDGASTGLSTQAREYTYRQATRWQGWDGGQENERLRDFLIQARAGGAEPSRGGDSEIRQKIIPFPGSPTARYKPGQRVTHATFGPGTVLESEPDGDDERVTVAFDDKRYGRKQVLASLARLDKL